MAEPMGPVYNPTWRSAPACQRPVVRSGQYRRQHGVNFPTDSVPMNPTPLQTNVGKPLMLGAVALLTAWVLSPFATPILAGVCMAVVSQPYLKKVLRMGISLRIAVMLNTLLWFVLLALPAWLIVGGAAPALAHVLHHPPQAEEIAGWFRAIPFVGDGAAQAVAHLLGTNSPMEWLKQWLTGHSAVLKDSAKHLWILILHIAVALLVMDGISYHATPLTSALRRGMTRLTGDAEFVNAALKLCAQSIQSVLAGMIGVALFCGVGVGLIMLGVGLPFAVGWAVAVAVASLIPMGTTLVILIASVMLLATKGFVPALVLFGLGHGVVWIADFWVRPYLIGARTHTPLLLTLMSILGGIEVFGLIGLILGPVIVLTALGLWRLWEQGHVDGTSSAP